MSFPQISPSLNGVRRATSNHWWFHWILSVRYSAGILYFRISELPSELALKSAVLSVRNSEFFCFSRVVQYMNMCLSIHMWKSSTWKWIWTCTRTCSSTCTCVYVCTCSKDEHLHVHVHDHVHVNADEQLVWSIWSPRRVASFFSPSVYRMQNDFLNNLNY